MKKLTIQKLRLKNFKGVQDFTLEPAGNNVAVFGDNAFGKTTIMDAYFWLIFGKDSQGKADFQLKPVDPEGREISNIDTEVEAVLEYNNKPVTLMKRYKEKWTKKRGAARAEFTGHTTDYFIDDVPAKKKEYDEKVTEIIDVNAFKLVTNPYEFNNLHWTGRRQILLEMCGDVTDQDVINSDDRLRKLKDIIGDCTIEDHKKKVQAKKREINKELDQIPARIDELTQSIKDAEKPAPNIIENLNSQISEKKDKLHKLGTTEAASEKKTRLHEINAEILKLKNEAQEKMAEKKKPLQDELEQLNSQYFSRENGIRKTKEEIETEKSRLKVLEDAVKGYRGDWHRENDKEFSCDTECPTCSQQIPEEQIEQAREKFNENKAAKLEEIQSKGKETAGSIEAKKESIAGLEKKLEEYTQKLSELQEKVKAKKKELQSIDAAPVDTRELEKEKGILQSELDAMNNGSKVKEDNLREEIKELEARVEKENEKAAEFKAAERSRERIKELEQREKDLAKEYEKLEEEIHLTEQFIIKKVELLEGQINERFKLARFKLFNTQINGGIEECCETIYKGVPFNHGLNNAARINIGLDIVNTLSEYFGFQGPIFIDNAESINEIIPMSAQVISLVVSRDQELIVSESEVKKAS